MSYVKKQNGKDANGMIKQILGYEMENNLFPSIFEPRIINLLVW